MKAMTIDRKTKETYDRIAKEMGDDRFFTRKELEHLPAMLQPGEDVLAFASGMMRNSTWLIALTSQRIILLDKGLLFGLKQVVIDLNKVNSIEGSTGVFFGKLVINDGSTAHEIDNVPKKTIAPFTSKANQALAARQRGGAPAGGDRISQLERLASLKASGVIDEAEFQAEKARIMSS
jgi:hypothetical protein